MAYELKTQKTEVSVGEFFSTVEPEERRADCERLRSMMTAATGDKGAMWGPNIVGFGSYSYRYASGHSGEWFLTGFSPRKPNITIYIMPGFERYDELLRKLGKHSIGKSCLYVKNLETVDTGVLEQLITGSVQVMRQQ
jgi:hypothetical protein